ncbi:transposase [Candidatus Kaiserbacteria bacterium]|nr:MAG: transposase [Candidatus Kaiserbacteria bacterium]
MDLYHALNRGVDKRIIFLDTQDYARFVHDMYEFNSTLPANHTRYSQIADLRCRQLDERLVQIHGWCLMPNHYHLLLSECIEGGISLFLRKLNVGYAKYFNERYNRIGTLFQGRTKKILIDSDAHFLHILNYIHFNPLDMQEGTSDWRMKKIDNVDAAITYLKSYRWSSYLDYWGIKNFPSILTTSLFQGVFNNNYTSHAEKYLRSISLETDIQSIRHLTFE